MTSVREVFPGYGVSADGVVWCNRPVNGKGSVATSWRVVKPLPSAGGRYLQVGIDGKKHLVHRLVARAFLGEPQPQHEVSHLNGNSHDNRAENLVYAIHADNERLKRAHGTATAGERNGRALLTQAAVDEIRSRAASPLRGTKAALAREYGVSAATISAIVHRKRWTE